jgi:hypothetical protein
MDSIAIRLSMQRALWGEITPTLRSVSGEADSNLQVVRIYFVFDSLPSEVDRECASNVAAEITADLHAGWKLEETVEVVPSPSPMHRLRELAYLRYEGY